MFALYSCTMANGQDLSTFGNALRTAQVSLQNALEHAFADDPSMQPIIDDVIQRFYADAFLYYRNQGPDAAYAAYRQRKEELKLRPTNQADIELLRLEAICNASVSADLKDHGNKIDSRCQYFAMQNYLVELSNDMELPDNIVQAMKDWAIRNPSWQERIQAGPHWASHSL